MALLHNWIQVLQLTSFELGHVDGIDLVREQVLLLPTHDVVEELVRTESGMGKVELA